MHDELLRLADDDFGARNQRSQQQINNQQASKHVTGYPQENLPDKYRAATPAARSIRFSSRTAPEYSYATRTSLSPADPTAGSTRSPSPTTFWAPRLRQF